MAVNVGSCFFRGNLRASATPRRVEACGAPLHRQVKTSRTVAGPSNPGGRITLDSLEPMLFAPAPMLFAPAPMLFAPAPTAAARVPSFPIPNFPFQYRTATGDRGTGRVAPSRPRAPMRKPGATVEVFNFRYDRTLSVKCTRAFSGMVRLSSILGGREGLQVFRNHDVRVDRREDQRLDGQPVRHVADELPQIGDDVREGRRV